MEELLYENQKFPMLSTQHKGYAIIKEEIKEAVEESRGTTENLEVLWSVICESGMGFECVGYIKDRAIKAAHSFKLQICVRS
ncbi:hypothetical protein [Anaerotignum sp.]|uniref:hypothetical protein n=1 Tax=Anaerotignum sp. TaxID=2039241 RepID=UPI00332E334C